MRVITIDGPAGAGKSTVARKLAEELGYLHLDSGALYRTVGYVLRTCNTNPSNTSQLKTLLDTISISILPEGRVILNGEDVTKEIRSIQGGKWASEVARLPQVRNWVTQTLRKLAVGRNVVVDGRDAGSVIFPNAQLKIYLTASAQIRAERRWNELRERGIDVPFEKVLEETVNRDKADTSRELSPLLVPKGAVVIDTTNMSVETVVSEIIKLVKYLEKGAEEEDGIGHKQK